MHDYQVQPNHSSVGKFPILADKLKDVKIEEPKVIKKSRKVLSKAERRLVEEAIVAGGSHPQIAKRFDVSKQTVGNICRDMRRAKLARHGTPATEPEALAAPIQPQPKRITQCVTECFDSIEHLNEDDKLRVLLSVAYLFGMSPGLGS